MHSVCRYRGVLWKTYMRYPCHAFCKRGSKCHHPDDTFRTRTVREPLTHEGSCPDASETCKPSAPTSPSPSTWPWRTKRCSATSPRPPSSSNCWSGIINRPHPLAWPGQRFLPKPGAIKLASVTPVQSRCPAQAGVLRSSFWCWWPCPEKRDNELRVASEFIQELTFGLLRSFP